MSEEVIDLPNSTCLLIEKIRELEDANQQEVLIKSVALYAYIHEQVGHGNKIFIVDKDRYIQREILFIKPERKENWFDKLGEEDEEK